MPSILPVYLQQYLHPFMHVCLPVKKTENINLIDEAIDDCYTDDNAGIRPVHTSCSLTFCEPLTLVNTHRPTHIKGRERKRVRVCLQTQAKQTTYHRFYNIAFMFACTQISEQQFVNKKY